MTLVAFFNNATSDQNSKLLATALWSMAKAGKNTFGTKNVTGALITAQQLKLNNQSQCLARGMRIRKLPGTAVFNSSFLQAVTISAGLPGLRG